MNHTSLKSKMPWLTGIMLTLLALNLSADAVGQRVVYSEPDRNEVKQTNFDIIGRYNNRILIFKNLRGQSYMSVYDEEMKLVENIAYPFIPPRIIEYDFLTFPDYSYLFFQAQRRNVVSLMVVKVGADGKPLTSPVELDTTVVNYNASKRVYSVLATEDKSKLMVFRVNSRNEKRYQFRTQLFDANLSAIRSSDLELAMGDKFDFLTEFMLDNAGNLVFGRGRRRAADENISQFYLIMKPAAADSFMTRELQFEGITLDEVKLRIDNTNNRYLFTSFYYKGRKGDIEGVANAIFDLDDNAWVVRNVIPLSNELRMDARGDNNLRAAFNDYYIRQIIVRRDGGFLMNAESIYQTASGGGAFNRWDMFGSPWMTPMDYYRWGMWGPAGMRWGGPRITRFHADNVIVLAFDQEGKLLLSNTIRKTQYDDESEATVSYSMVNTGNALHYLYNETDKRDVSLTFQSLDSDGRVVRNPAMRNLDPRYSFMPRYARQVGARTVIVPCLFRNYLCFARIDF